MKILKTIALLFKVLVIHPSLFLGLAVFIVAGEWWSDVKKVWYGKL